MGETVAHVVGARPNFMKAAPVIAASPPRVEQRLIHTGQHYDQRLSGVFFDELDCPPRTSISRSARAATRSRRRPSWSSSSALSLEAGALVVVYGDVNSTLAAALVCAKRRIPLAHVEAGLRSFDPTMPEEINRRVTDQLSDLLFVTSPEAVDNLRREGRRTDGRRLRGQPDDRHAPREPGALRRGRPAAATSSAGPTRSPRSTGRRTSTRPRPHARWSPMLARRARRAADRAAAPSSRPDHLDGPACPRSAPAGHRAARLRALPVPRPRCGGRGHRLRRHPGGDDLPRHAVPHRPPQHRAAHHHLARHEPAHRARRCGCRRRCHRGGSAGASHEPGPSLGWSCRRANCRAHRSMARRAR